MCGVGGSGWRSPDRPEPGVPEGAVTAPAPKPPDWDRDATDRARRAARSPRRRWATAIFRYQVTPTTGWPPGGAGRARAGSRARRGCPAGASLAERLPVTVGDRRDDIAEDLARPHRGAEPVFASVLRRGGRHLGDGLTPTGDQ